LPASRLQPLPFFEPGRLIAFIEQDPSLLEPGLRLIAREVPMPSVGAGAKIDLLAADGDGRVVAILIAAGMTGGHLETALAARTWLRENHPTLRSLNPVLAECGEEVRCLILAGAITRAGRAFLAHMAEPRPEVLEVSCFESASGPAICVQPVRPGIPFPEVRPPEERAPALRETVAGFTPRARLGDPLSGIPISPEEAAEFRRLVSPPPARGAGRETRPAPRTVGEPPGGFSENCHEGEESTPQDARSGNGGSGRNLPGAAGPEPGEGGTADPGSGRGATRPLRDATRPLCDTAGRAGSRAVGRRSRGAGRRGAARRRAGRGGGERKGRDG